MRTKQARTERVTLTLDEGAAFLARRAAERDGASVSAWVSQAIKQVALAQCWGPQEDPSEAEQDALLDLREADMAERGAA